MTNHTYSPIDVACDDYVDLMARTQPEFATEIGSSAGQDRWSDYSPAGLEERACRAREFMARVAGATPVDAVDEVTQATVADRVGVEVALFEAGEWHRETNNLASPVQTMRDTLDLMDTEDPAYVENVRGRLARLGEALEGYRESLEWAAARGQVASVRALAAVADQAEAMVAPDSKMAGFVARFPQLEEAVGQARRAAVAFAQWLREELVPKAPVTDAVGRERYELFSHHFVGARVDLDEAYLWGLETLAEIASRQEELARRLYGPGVSAREAMDRLNADAAYQLRGTKALQEWMQATADGAIEALAGTVFDVPAPVRRIECCVDYPGTGGIYYTSPSADFSRPGRMWWSVPEGEDTFSTWSELTTVYHEGVPGHHLQIGQTTCEGESLNKWRRLACWNSGHGEGWALYAEQLMFELGFYEGNPAGEMGMWDAQRLRAARVALDIGVHCQKTNPDGGVWDRDYAWDFLKRNVAMADGFLSFELDRYLTWPGQAPSYLLGQRLWQQVRQEFVQAHPGDQDAALRAFHSKALALGSLPMGILRQEVLR